jgi:spore coat polysaccharide biosynthesis protein SpsF (cytidylyltransferase family)
MSLRCQVAVLHPNEDDLLLNAFKSSGAIMIGGEEKDVLSRYAHALRLTQADYIVRLTSDCPLMLDFVISKHIHTAAFYKHDYVSNVDESCRFIADGFDCEVLSRRALAWLNDNAVLEHDREHVTTLLRAEKPKHLSMACVTMKIDTSHMKMSVDTAEDLERIRAYYHEREKKIALAKSIYGMKLYDL